MGPDMSSRGEKLFRAWQDSEIPFEEGTGRGRFLEAFGAKRARPRRRVSLVLAAAAALAVGGACAGALVWWRTPPTLSFTTGEGGATGEGRTGEWLATGSANELPLDFSEGTHVVLAADSRGRVEEVGRAGAVVVVERGEVRAHVVHRANTSWRFRAGPFDVQVTGTTLAVEWDPQRERFTVKVDEGAVLVRGPSVGGSVVRAHEQCVVDVPTRSMRLMSSDDGAGAVPPIATAAPAATVAQADASGEISAPAPSPTAPPSINPVRPAAIGWSTLERRGEYEAAYDAARDAGFASVLRASSADDLLRLAQLSQLSRHSDSAREAWLACRQRFPGTVQADVAAYELGRASAPAEAVRWFDTCLREQPAGPLAREASGRLIEAATGAGNSATAREAATRYLARYPSGPHAALARRILSRDP
jgi:hypothetical protein